jgi:hypothetical protein
MLMRVLLLLELLAATVVPKAVAAPGNSYLVSGGPIITGITLSKSYFTGVQAPTTTIGVLTVSTTGMAFTGTLALGGPAASSFVISGNNLNANATLNPGTDYSITVTPTQAGVSGSGLPTPLHIYGGVTYYISPSGNDSNNGTVSSNPWLTPNHAVHCADTIMAATGTYLPANFTMGKWGTVSCPNNDNVAFIQCVTFDACYIIGDYGQMGALLISASYWGVRGFEAQDDSASYGGCFSASPPTPNATIHHIVFADNVAVRCPLAGFDSFEYNGATGPSSVDYVMWVGNIAWNATRASTLCGSGFSFASPANADNAQEPHDLFTLNMAWNNVNGSNCAGGGVSGGNTDGQGIIIDRPDVNNYTAAITVEGNLLISNGGPGFHQGALGPVYPRIVTVRYNTTWGNAKDPLFCPFTTAESNLNEAGVATVTNNILMATVGVKCGGSSTVYATQTSTVSPTTIVDNNWLWNSANSANISITWNSGISCASGPGISSPGSGKHTSAYCPGNTVADPVFSHPTIPAQPTCSGTADTIACATAMGIIANFTPTANGSTAYGWLAKIPSDKWNNTAYFRNVLHVLPASLNPHGY